MVNLCKSNTELLALDAKTTKAFTDEWYTRDVAVENYDKLTMQELSMCEPSWRTAIQLHNPVVYLEKVTGKRKYTKRKKAKLPDENESVKKDTREATKN